MAYTAVVSSARVEDGQTGRPRLHRVAVRVEWARNVAKALPGGADALGSTVFGAECPHAKLAARRVAGALAAGETAHGSQTTARLSGEGLQALTGVVVVAEFHHIGAEVVAGGAGADPGQTLPI